MYERRYGSKYEQGRDVRDIAKLIRKDLAELTKITDAPWKFSVRIDRFSMGQSIDVTIKRVDFPVYVYDTEYPGSQRYTPEAKAAIAAIEAVVDAYNYDGSDSRTDYFDVDFYSHVTIDTSEEVSA